MVLRINLIKLENWKIGKLENIIFEGMNTFQIFKLSPEDLIFQFSNLKIFQSLI